MKSSVENRLWGVILAGGIGSRFWPASTPARPKQLLRLASDRPMIRDTVDRIEPLIPVDRLRVLTGESLSRAMAPTLDEFSAENYLLEPRAAGTGPVLAWAAWVIHQRQPDAVMVSLHADHIIEPASLFREQLLEAATLADSHNLLFTLGATPNRPEIGYGYIRPGKPIHAPDIGSEAFEVGGFVEKPDLPTATRYVESGYLWNSGIFIWRVSDLLEQLERHSPEIAAHLPALDRGGAPEFFASVPTISIDEGLLERSDRVGVLRTRFRWDDVGAWDAVFRSQPLDSAGNAVIGEGYAVDSGDSVLYAEDGPVVAFGVQNLVIVRSSGVTFVMDRRRSAELKKLLGALPERLRTLE